ncbi:hypothetical protein SAMN04489844_3928 [Nocardioides exalbidus]|uniref:Uncharacterized protein n=1 Tax=Nocardioides exalbidus TaxID=402596 RepID=A0A1H4YW92_9ACTN|nr:hypothetical protein [Nocardioides exalbidus]SED21290.1 hypothetical protein SAMN04489844_3928 [Nocardioides exalbidus]
MPAPAWAWADEFSNVAIPSACSSTQTTARSPRLARLMARGRVAAPAGAVTAQGLVDGWHRAVLVKAVVSLVGAVVVALLGERRERSEQRFATLDHPVRGA